MADDDRIYLIVNGLDSSGHFYGESLTSIPMNGTICAWSRQDNRFLWKRNVDRQNIVIDRFAVMPVLLFVAKAWRRPAMDMGYLNIAAIDKQTGQLLIDDRLPSAYSGFHALSINAEEPSIELKSYNARLKLVPLGAPAEPRGNPAQPRERTPKKSADSSEP